MTAVFPFLSPERYEPHPLHAGERIWPETNCYVDLWIEVLNTMRLPPEAMLGFTLTQDFEGDQFTFFKVPLDDLEALYGIRVGELAIFDRVDEHIVNQIDRGRLCLVEMDSFFMPDTQGVAYRNEHGKTTVAVNRLSAKDKVIDYFHNGGYYRVSGEDFDGLFGKFYPQGSPPFLPYTEFAKLPDRLPGDGAIRDHARTLLYRHIERMPDRNPVAEFAKVLPDQVALVADRPFEFFHKYAFNTLRQLGANFELLATHLRWMSDFDEFSTSVAAAYKIAETAKSVQFQMARAVTRRRFDTLAQGLDPAIEAWDLLKGAVREAAD
jgi:hypothetical protein